jgi:hypothetical protein
MPEWLHYFTLLSGVNFMFLAYFAVRSRDWTGPAIASKLEQLENEIASNSANIAALQRDREYDRRIFDSVLENLAKEIRILATSVGAMTEIRDKVEAVDVRSIEIEQQIAALACSEADWHTKHNNCPPELKAKFTNGSSSS